jgi:hypothetical protein
MYGMVNLMENGRHYVPQVGYEAAAFYEIKRSVLSMNAQQAETPWLRRGTFRESEPAQRFRGRFYRVLMKRPLNKLCNASITRLRIG